MVPDVPKLYLRRGDWKALDSSFKPLMNQKLKELYLPPAYSKVYCAMTVHVIQSIQDHELLFVSFIRKRDYVLPFKS